jgi:hypothetical protein
VDAPFHLVPGKQGHNFVVKAEAEEDLKTRTIRGCLNLGDMITHILELDAQAEAHTDPYRSPPAMYGSDQRIYCSWPANVASSLI